MLEKYVESLYYFQFDVYIFMLSAMKWILSYMYSYLYIVKLKIEKFK